MPPKPTVIKTGWHLSNLYAFAYRIIGGKAHANNQIEPKRFNTGNA